MSLEIAIYITTFAIIGASLLLGRKGGRTTPASSAEALPPGELDELVRPTLLFSRTISVAHC